MSHLKFFPLIFAVFLIVRLLSAQTGNQEVIVPIVATGAVSETSEFETTFRFPPLTIGATGSFEISGFTNEGGLFNVACDFTPISTYGQTPGGFSYRICNGAPRFPNQSVDGWVKVTTPESVEIIAEIASIQNSQRLGIFTVPAVKPAKNFRSLIIETREGLTNRQSAFAIVNPSRTEVATVDLTIIDRFGNPVLFNGKTLATQVVVPPLRRTSKFLSEFLTGAEIAPMTNAEFLAKREGFSMVRFTGSIPIAVGGLQMVSSPSGVQFISMPSKATD